MVGLRYGYIQFHFRITYDFVSTNRMLCAVYLLVPHANCVTVLIALLFTELPETHIDGFHAAPVSDLREVHFVRLLTVVLQEHQCAPPSVSSHAHLSTIIHPFDS